MIKELSLPLKEGPYIDLTSLDIDWNKFNINCVQYFMRYEHLTNDVYLKNIDKNLPVEKQVLRYGAKPYYVDTNDTFGRIATIFKNKKTENFYIPEEKDYKFFNTDLEIDFPYVVEVIKKIEEFTNITFGRTKLRVVNPLEAETVHTDHGLYRYHLPIVTNDNVFFVVGDEIFNMKDSGKLYKFRTDIPHTVVNAAVNLKRIHLVACDSSYTFDFSKEAIEKTNNEYFKIGIEELKKIDEADYLLNGKVYKDAKINLLKEKNNS